MGLYGKLAGLPFQIDGYRLTGSSRKVSTSYERLTTTVCLRGRGEDGLGEEVTYHAGDQSRFRRFGVDHDLAGRFTVEEFSERLDSVDLFDRPPSLEASHDYRRWAFESAALDLALRQNGLTLHAALGIEPQPLRFVFSPGLDAPPAIDPLPAFLELYPAMRFKLDASGAWTEKTLTDLAATGAVEVVDLKGAYRGTPVDQPPDRELYHRVVDALPEVWIEDPALTDQTDAVLSPHRDRVTWDAPIHSIEDIEALPFAPSMLNIKPSRFGRLRTLLDTYDYCRGREIGMYGGGQFELGPGRGQIQYLASIFHPSGPNDVAPTVYHGAGPARGLPQPPLAPGPAEVGFRWLEPGYDRGD
jgi:hypothetical protein